MKANSLLRSMAAMLLASTIPAQATLIGYNADPGGSLWDRGDADTAWASFDLFSTPTFSGQSPESSFGFSSPGLSQSEALIPPAGVFSGDRIYTHDSATDFSLSATTSFAFKTVVLQIKEFNGTAFDAAWSPTLNGLAFDSKTVTPFVESSSDQNIYTYTWSSSLASNTSTSLTIDWGNFGPTFGSFDGVQVDAALIPEPSTGALAALAGAFATYFCRSRRRRAAA
jgi:hypothetical protein